MKISRYLLTVLIFGVLFFLGYNTYSQAPNVTIYYNTSGLAPGSQITVPVVINASLAGSYNFNLDYDRDVLTYVSGSYTGPPYGIALYGTITPNWLYNGNYYLKLNFTYSAASPNPPNGTNYTNDTVFLLTFTFNGGSTQISFFNIAQGNTIGTQYSYLRANPYNIVNNSTVYSIGTVSGNYSTLTSIANGGDWNTASTWQENSGGGTKTPNGAYNVIITSNPVTIAPSGNTAKCHDLTINSGGKLTLNSGKTLTTSGLFAINSEGSFIDQNTSSSLTATVKRTITGNYNGSGTAGPNTIWHYVSSPVTNGVIGTFMYCLLNKWTEPTSYWDTLCLPTTLPLETGRGYSVAATPYFGTAIFNGPLNTGDLTKNNLTNSDPSYPTYVNNYGYHLLGNPYPSALKWDANITRTNMDAAIYLWNGSTYISKLPTDNFEIQAMQGFFVHANANGGSVVLKNSNRVHNSGAFLKSTVENQMTLTVTGNNLSDETSVRFSGLSTNGFDSEYDALKLFGISSCPQIYSILPDLDLSVNSLPDLNSQLSVPVGFKSGLAGTFSLSVSGLESFATGTDFYLTDLLTGHVQNLTTNPVYEFTADPSNPEHRFNLHFAPVGIGSIDKNRSIRIYSFDKDVFINVLDDLTGYALVYDMLGKEIIKTKIEPESLNKIGLNVPQGGYIVKVITDRMVVTEKVLVR